MTIQSVGIRQVTTLMAALSCIALSAIGGADSVVNKRQPNLADQELFFAPVPKAVCGPGDKPETALQGQVPYALRIQPGGFQGFSCNLQLIGQVKGEGANWQTTEWREGKGKRRKVCGYHGTAAPTANNPPRSQFGVRVIDISDPAKPYNTTYLTTTAMLDPWESLKVNERRQVLGAVEAANGGGGAGFDIYDISGDCRYPQLLSTNTLVNPNGTPVVGHEGSWAPDGLTYYGSDVRTTLPGANSAGQYYAIDTTNTLSPKFITSWPKGVAGGNIHGLSVSDDGTRGYFTSMGSVQVGQLLDNSVPANNGMVVFDLSDIQARRPNPQVRTVSTLFWKDGAMAQHTINVKIKGRPYIVFVDEAGSAGNTVATRQAACDAGMAPFPMARIIDMSDERNPRVISKLMLEIHDPANCAQVLPDIVGLTSFTHGSHYCSVDNVGRATTLVCGYFSSGIRVFDIRDPIRPREIAYYNPPGVLTASPGSNHATAGRGWMSGHPDWCAAQSHLDADLGTVWTTCQDNGVLSLKFTHNAWPFAESRTPPGRQNNN